MIRGLWMVAVVVGCTTPEVPDAAVDCDVASDHPRADALQALVDRPVAQGVPGIGIAVMTPDGIWQGAAGKADIENDIAMTPCHVHSWESIGKTWFAALALRLADAGELGLDGRAADVLAPEVVEGLANADQATFRELMQHVTGLPDFNEDLGYLGNELDDPLDDDTPSDLLDFVRGEPAHFAIGDDYRYSDSNFVLVALAADALRGDRSQAMRDEVFEPLGLTHTWAPRPGDAVPEGRVASYWEVAGGQLENVSDYQAAYDVQVPGGGGILGTPVEHAIFANAIARGTLLSPEMHTAQLAWSPQSEAWAEARDRDDGFAYGLGLSRREWTIGGASTTWVGHTGGGAGTTALMMARPDADYAVAIAANLGGFLGGPLNAFIDEDWVQEVLTAASAAP